MAEIIVTCLHCGAKRKINAPDKPGVYRLKCPNAQCAREVSFNYGADGKVTPIMRCPQCNCKIAVPTTLTSFPCPKCKTPIMRPSPQGTMQQPRPVQQQPAQQPVQPQRQAQAPQQGFNVGVERITAEELARRQREAMERTIAQASPAQQPPQPSFNPSQAPAYNPQPQPQQQPLQQPKPADSSACTIIVGGANGLGNSTIPSFERCELVISRGFLSKERFPLSPGKNIVGRRDDKKPSDISIDRDDSISRRSICIDMKPVGMRYQYEMTILNALNPVFHNKAQHSVGDKIFLEPGDIIRLGNTDIKFNACK